MKTKTSKSSMLSIGEASRLLHIHSNTLRRWTDQGIIKAYRDGPRGARKFKAEDIGLKTMLTVSEVKELLHMHSNTLRRWSDKGLVKAQRLGPRGDRRYSREDIINLVKELAGGNTATESDTPLYGQYPLLVIARK